MFLLICLASGSVWGLIGTYIVTDGRFDRAGLVAAALSPGIGIIMGHAGKRVAASSWVGRCAYTLAALFVATGLFGIVWGVAQPAVANVAASTSPFVRAGSMVVFIWWGIVFGGDVLWLWPLSLINHMLIWNWLTVPRVRTPQPLGLTATGADGIEH